MWSDLELELEKNLLEEKKYKKYFNKLCNPSLKEVLQVYINNYLLTKRA